MVAAGRPGFGSGGCGNGCSACSLDQFTDLWASSPRRHCGFCYCIGSNAQGGQPRQGQGQSAGKRSGGQPGGQGKPRNGKPTGRPNGQPRHNNGPRREETRPLREPAVADPRNSKQPLIIRKGERLPSLEQLESLENKRPRGERPALLTRKNSSDE